MARVAHVPEHGPCGPCSGAQPADPLWCQQAPLDQLCRDPPFGSTLGEIEKKTFVCCILLVPNIGIEKFFKAPPAKQPTKKPQAPPGVAPAAEGLVDTAATTTGTATNGEQEQVDVDSRKPPKPAFQPLGERLVIAPEPNLGAMMDSQCTSLRGLELAFLCWQDNEQEWAWHRATSTNKVCVHPSSKCN